MDFLENINIVMDIDKGILQNIDIDKISYRLEFGISNRANGNNSHDILFFFLGAFLPLFRASVRAKNQTHHLTWSSQCSCQTTQYLLRQPGKKTNMKPIRKPCPRTLQLHSIQCPFPNQIQLVWKKNFKIFMIFFQTKFSLVWKIILSNDHHFKMR